MTKKQSTLEFQVAFGKQIEVLRTQQNLSFRQLAQRCDIDFSNISKIEKGEVNIQLGTILELSKGLNVKPMELFDFKFEVDNE